MNHHSSVKRYNLIGHGNAGTAFDDALQRVGYLQHRIYHRGDAVSEAAQDVDFILLCTPDAHVAEIASAIRPGSAVVIHCAGSLGLDALSTHAQRAVLHPLVSLTKTGGADALLNNANYGISGNEIASLIVGDLDGNSFVIDDEHRVLYHAAAVVACNHMVALLAQAERIAAQCGVPLQAYESLVRGSIDNVFSKGASQSLTGPIARGDTGTVERHLRALNEEEQPGYKAGVELAKRLVELREPVDHD